jgi:arsenate reductase
VVTRLFWPFEDPARVQGTEEEKIAKFREVRDQIDLKIKEWLKEKDNPEIGKKGKSETYDWL